MSHAAKVLTDELTYLRAMHTTATGQGKTIIANSLGEDIADLVVALEVLTAPSHCGTNTTPTEELSRG